MSIGGERFFQGSRPMPLQDSRIQLNAQTGAIRGCEEAVLQYYRLAQDLAVERVSVELLDQEVGRASIQLDGRGHGHRPAVHMGRDHGVMRLGDAGDLLRLQNAAALPHIYLDDLRCLFLVAVRRIRTWSPAARRKRWGCWFARRPAPSRRHSRAGPAPQTSRGCTAPARPPREWRRRC